MLLPALWAAVPTHAQQFMRLHMHTIKVSQDTLRLDSLTIVEGSVLMTDRDGNRIDSSTYVLDAIKGTLVWTTPPKTDSVKVIYRTLPFNINKSYYNKDLSKIEHTEDYIANPFSYNPSQAKKEPIIDFGSLDYNGSFARGISFGNNQDAVVNSNFNLQLAGNIGQGVEINAAITDNNIPIQPDGNTQQLQQFDKIYIQVTKKPHQMIVGDFEVGSPRGYFMKFYKNLQGGGYRTTLLLPDSSTFRTSVNLAVAKGKFTKNTLPVTEGNQGPYRLIGASGETFIIVLAGTEKVFVNGQLMKRGAENDYVIDYNLGEITFTPNRLITQDLRVTVEFEYSEKSYFRSFVYVNNEYDRKKVKFNLNVYSEQDSKNQPVNSDLTSEQKQFLATIGNNLDKAVYPGYTREAFNTDHIQYRLVRDTVVNGTTYDSVFVYSTSTTDSLYVLNFSYAGPNNGYYSPSVSTANGRVYQWNAPVNGVLQGSYIPVIVLITPKRQQMIVGGMEYTPTKYDLISLEAAMSNNDNNLFSPIGNKNNIGTSEKVGYQRLFLFGQKDTTGSNGDSSKMPMSIIVNGDYEFRNHNFKQLERYRPVEFSRNWNYDEATGDTIDQHIASAGITFSKPGWVRESYSFGTFLVDGYYKGYMHTITGAFNHAGYRLEHTISYLNTDGPTQKSTYLKPKILAEKSFKKVWNWRIGGIYEHEDNQIRDPNIDTLQTTSFDFTDWRVYIASPDSSRNKGRLEYIRRLEFKPGDDHFHLSTLSNTYNFTGEWNTNPINSLKWQATYRRFFNKDSAQYNNNKPDDYYLGRVEYALNVLHGAIITNILYELGAGKQQRLDYTYLPVGAGLGNYIWRDYNHDGIKQIDEFEVATFTEDTMYVRVVNPTNEYDPVNNTQYSQVLSLTPKALLHDKKGFAGFVGLISTVTSFQIDRKVYRSAKQSPFNPFVFNIDDTALVSTNSSIRNSVFFNRTGSKYSLEYTFSNNGGKSNLSTGSETHQQREHLVRVRWNIIKSLNTVLKGSLGYRSNNSVAFTDRNYYIKYYTTDPEFNWLFKNKFRLTLTYDFSLNKNTLSTGNGERALNHGASLDARYSLVSKTSLNAKFSFTNVDYNGTADNSLEFAMLQGLKDGKNYVWSFSFDRTIGKNIQLNLTYEGHKTGIANTVHTGRAQVRAIF